MTDTPYNGPERRGRPALTVQAAREDRRSPVRRILDLIKGELVTSFVRAICVAAASAMFFLGKDPAFNPSHPAYSENAVFEGVFTAAHPVVWGVMFLAASVTLLLAALTARAAVYVVGVVYSTVILTAWASMVSYSAWTNPEAHLTSGAYGLYIFSFTALVGLAFSPRQIDAEKEIVAVDEQGASLVPLKVVG